MKDEFTKGDLYARFNKEYAIQQNKGKSLK